MKSINPEFTGTILLAFTRIRHLFDGAGGLHSDLKEEALMLLDAIMNPEAVYKRDLVSGVEFLIHLLEDSRWKMSEFLTVMESHEYLSAALVAGKKELA